MEAYGFDFVSRRRFSLLSLILALFRLPTDGMVFNTNLYSTMENKNIKVGDKLWFHYEDGSVMGWTVTEIRPTSYRDYDGNSVESHMVHLKPDDKELADTACYEHEIYNDGLSENDERVVAYERKRLENLNTEEKSRLFDVAVDCLFEQADGWDWICEELMNDEEENVVCEETCQNLTRECIIRLLKQRAKNRKS